MAQMATVNNGSAAESSRTRFARYFGGHERVFIPVSRTRDEEQALRNVGVSGVWADETGVGSDCSGSAAAVRAARREADWKGLYFGSVVLEGDRGHVEAWVAAVEHIDVLAVRSRASREPPDVDVLRVLHKVRRRPPLAVVFDATPESVGAYLPYVDCVLAAPASDDGPCELDPIRVRELSHTIHAYSKH